jgi:hypothetical protein
MARIDGIPAARAGLLVRLGYWMAQRMVGKLPEPMMVMAHHDWIFRAYGAYEYAFRKARRVEEKLKVLASIRAATLVGCPF